MRIFGASLRPPLILALSVAAFSAIDAHEGVFLSEATAYSAFETFATGALVALGLSLAMLIREFDLSVVGLFSLGGCVAVLLGADQPWLGVLAATTLGAAAGAAQGWLIARLRLSSVGVTLGGLLAFSGLAYVFTENRSIPYENLDVALALANKIGGVFSIRSLVALAVYAIAAFVIGATRVGRELIAMGSDRQAAVTAGAPVEGLLIATFAFSGFCAALSGTLLSYSLAAASPSGLTDIIPPAAAAAILGGVSLGGGTGSPLGVACGVMTLAVLRAGFNALGAPPFVNDMALGAVLMSVAIADGRDVARRFWPLRRARSA